MNTVYVKFSRLLFIYMACFKWQHREKQIIVSRGPCFVWLSWDLDVSWHHNTDFKYLRFISRNDIHVKQCAALVLPNYVGFWPKSYCDARRHDRSSKWGWGRQLQLCRAAANVFSKERPAAGNVNLPAQALVQCLITSLIHRYTDSNTNKCSTIHPRMLVPWMPLKQSKIVYSMK